MRPPVSFFSLVLSQKAKKIVLVVLILEESNGHGAANTVNTLVNTHFEFCVAHTLLSFTSRLNSEGPPKKTGRGPPQGCQAQQKGRSVRPAVLFFFFARFRGARAVPSNGHRGSHRAITDMKMCGWPITLSYFLPLALKVRGGD